MSIQYFSDDQVWKLTLLWMSLQYGCPKRCYVSWRHLAATSVHTNIRQYICFVLRDTVDLAVVRCALAVSTDRVCRERAKSGSGSGSGGDRARVFNVRGVVLVGRFCEGGVRPRLVQVDVGDVQTDVVFSLQAGQDGGDSRHQRGKTGPQLWIRVPALKHNAIPAKTRVWQSVCVWARRGWSTLYVSVLASIKIIYTYSPHKIFMFPFRRDKQRLMVLCFLSEGYWIFQTPHSHSPPTEVFLLIMPD